MEIERLTANMPTIRGRWATCVYRDRRPSGKETQLRMILKELDPPAADSDSLARAGREAEETMAFYLRRAFGEREEVYVFNGVRLERDGDAAQIDHLILHRAGIVIVESKSVHGRVRVNEHSEWSRTFGGRAAHGMASPIEQAKRQAVFLKRYLDEHATELAGKMLGLVQARFGALSVDVVISISDTGIIERPKRLALPEVCKADQAAAKVEALLAEQRRVANPLNLMNLNISEGRGLSKSEIANILAFLMSHHRPLSAPKRRDARAADAVPPQSPPATPGQTPATCVICAKEVTDKVRDFCRANSERFGGHVYCFQHQRQARGRTAQTAPRPLEEDKPK